MNSKFKKIMCTFVISAAILALFPSSVYCATLTQKIDLRNVIESRKISIRDQGSRGTCVQHAMTFLQEYQFTGLYGKTYNHLSIDFATQAGSVATGDTGESSSFKKFALGYNTYGVVLNSDWQYNSSFVYDFNFSNAIFNSLISRGKVKLKSDGFRLGGKCLREGNNGTVTTAQIDEVISYLKKGVPVAQAHGGHSTAIIGYEKYSDGTGAFIYRNSWGTGFGERGYGKYPFSEIQAENAGVAFFVYEAYIGPPPIVYKHDNYSGYSAALVPGSYNLEQLNNIGIINDDITSLRVPYGYTVKLYQHHNFTGTVKTYKGTPSGLNIANLRNEGFNDETSSIVVVKG